MHGRRRRTLAALAFAGVALAGLALVLIAAPAGSLRGAEAGDSAGSPADPGDPAAERHYLLGRYHWNQRTAQGLDSAVYHFTAAIRRDSTYAPAYAGLADVHVLGAGPAGSDGFRLAIDAARTAIRLDPRMAEAYASLGFALMAHEHDWAGAERAFRQAIALDPNYATAHQWYAELLVARGRLDEAIEHARLAEELDRGSVIIGWNVARALGFARRHDEALAQLRRLAPMHPGDERIVLALVAALVQRGEYDEAAVALERFLAAAPAALSEPGKPEAVAALLESVRAGREDALLSYYETVQPPGTGSEGHQRMFTAIGLAAEGQVDSAVRMLEAVAEDGDVGIGAPDLVAGSYFDPLRDDARFSALLRGMGLDPQIGLRLRSRDTLTTANPRRLPRE